MQTISFSYAANIMIQLAVVAGEKQWQSGGAHTYQERIRNTLGTH
jgi:hypothetical protein